MLSPVISPTPITLARVFRENTQDIDEFVEYFDVDFTNESLDPENNFNLPSNTYIVPITGYYLVIGTIYYGLVEEGDEIKVSINVNDERIMTSHVIVGTTVSFVYMSVTVSDLIFLNAGDLLKLQVWLRQSSGGTSYRYIQGIPNGDFTSFLITKVN